MLGFELFPDECVEMVQQSWIFEERHRSQVYVKNHIEALSSLTSTRPLVTTITGVEEATT